MTPRLTWEQPHPPGGRILARSGETVIGAVYPPIEIGKPRWLLYPASEEGHARNISAAKNALADAFADWCRRTGLHFTEEPA